MSVFVAILCQLAGVALIHAASTRAGIRTYIQGSEINRRNWQRVTEDASATSIIGTFLAGLAFLALALALAVQSLW